jgi:MYXO-CTERM domain-containing protein
MRKFYALSGLILASTILLLAGPAGAVFSIAYTVSVEERPAVAFNSVNGEYLAVWHSDAGGSTLFVQRISKTGTLLGSPISVLIPGVPATATGRPALAYSPVSNTYVVAVNRYYGPNVDNNFLHVGTLDGATAVQTEAYGLFFDSEFHDPDGFKAGAVRLTYNPIGEEFLASYQRTVVVDEILGTKHNVISTQRYAVGSGPYGAQQEAISYGLSNIHSHDVEFGEYILEWFPPADPVFAARYLIASGSGAGSGISEIGLNLLDGTGGYHLGVGFTSGVDGSSGYPAIASGRLSTMSRPYWMVVWHDTNNLCYSGGHFFVESCAGPEWSGIWGTYIDPWRTSYGPGPDNAVFPVSKIGSHIQSTTPEIAFSETADRFYVAWREYPGEGPFNNETRSHIRANAIDYFVSSEPSPVPYDNYVVSPVTGTCPPAPAGCLSLEDPVYPTVAAGDDSNALVAWEQKYPPNPTDHDVWGDIVTPSEVPEPGGTAMLGAGVLLLIALARRRGE